MTTWGLIGGPQNETTGDSGVPVGYVSIGPGAGLGFTYAFELREADEVYRWEPDVQYLADGRSLLDDMKNGRVQYEGVSPEEAAVLTGMTIESFAVTLGLIADMPQSEEAQMARGIIDGYRAGGWDFGS
jgi:hypothetical protein